MTQRYITRIAHCLVCSIYTMGRRRAILQGNIPTFANPLSLLPPKLHQFTDLRNSG